MISRTLWIAIWGRQALRIDHVIQHRVSTEANDPGALAIVMVMS